MIQATPFDLVLLTGAADEPVADYIEHYGQILEQFTQCRERFLDVNRRLAENPELAKCGLRLPLTKKLFWQLCNTPPWSQVQPRSALYLLKTAVLSFLGNRQRATNATLYLNDAQIVHVYQLLDATSFFPGALAADLCAAWVEVMGACVFAGDNTNSHIVPQPVHAAWVIAAARGLGIDHLNITRTHVLAENGASEQRTVPVLTQDDVWTWEFRVREALWQDRRLPFNGPQGPFGFRPPPGWQPGESLTQTRVENQRGYQDVLSGLWQWEGGRARVISPLDGHWNVQLVNSTARHNWIRYLEEIYQQAVRMPAHANHINVEVDGQIGDCTFELV